MQRASAARCRCAAGGLRRIKAQNGWRCAVAFVIQMECVDEVRPNITTHPEFAAALAQAKAAGVKILFLLCCVTPDSLAVMQMREQK